MGKTFYCTISKPSTELIMNVQDITGPGNNTYPATTLEDFKQLIADHKPTAVMFYIFGWPRRPVSVDNPKLEGHFKRLIRSWSHIDPNDLGDDVDRMSVDE